MRRKHETGMGGSFAMAAAFFIILATVGSGGRAADPAPLTIMSFNIRCLAVEDGRDFWSFRKNEVAALISRHAPDLAGLQEVYTPQAHDLAKRLPGCKWFGPPRNDGKRRGERCPIFYRADRLELIEHATFWLSETPEVAGSISWDSACRRLVTWGRFRDRETGAVFFLFNTHFDHQGKVAREMSARLLLERVRKIAGGSPVIVTGDFNSSDDSVPVQTITGVLSDARLVSKSPPQGPEGTSRDFDLDSVVGRRIDYVFVGGGVRVLGYAALDDTYGKGRRPSDHLPISARLMIGG